jgi:hypothetical protein
MASNAANTLTINNGGTVTMTVQDVYGGVSGPNVTLAPTVINAGGLLQNSGNIFNGLGPLTLAGGTLQGNGGAGSFDEHLGWFGGGGIDGSHLGGGDHRGPQRRRPGPLSHPRPPPPPQRVTQCE